MRFPQERAGQRMRAFALAALCTAVSVVGFVDRAFARSGESLALAHLLHADGTVALNTGYTGTVDVTGFRMETDSSGAPHFVRETSSATGPGFDAGQPVAETAAFAPDAGGNWDARFGGPPGVGGTVLALAVIGTDLYVGGNFLTAGGLAANHVARWDGVSWHALGAGLNGDVLAVIGSDLYAGGAFTTAGGQAASHVAKWDQLSWSSVGSGVNGEVRALTAVGTDLYAGGLFTTAVGGTVYAGGTFTTAGGVAALRIARWNGSAWSALGAGMNGTVHSLAAIGSSLYAGGFFTTAGGVSADYIARWNESAWSALGKGMDSGVYSLIAIGTDLYAGGDFTTAGGAAADIVAKWNGTAWSALDTGTNGVICARRNWEQRVRRRRFHDDRRR